MPKDNPPGPGDTPRILEELKKAQKLVRAIPSSDGLEVTVRAIKSFCTQWKTIHDVQVRFAEPFATRLNQSNTVTSASIALGRHSSGSPAVEGEADLFLQTASSGRSLYVVPGEDKSSSAHAGFAAAYCVPLQTQCREEILAVLIAGSYDAAGISNDIRSLLDLIAPQLALVLENAFLRQQGSHQVHDHPAIPADKRHHRPRVHSGLQTSHLAHEIKNALTAVSTFMQLLPTKWDDRHFRSSFYPVAREEARQANRLVSALLDRGRHHAGHLVPVDIQELVRQLVRLKTPLAEQRALRFRTCLALRSPTIRIDPQKIKEAVANLINNAMEATPKGGQIDIRLSDERLAGGQPAIWVEIQDSGPGVAPNIRDRIFEPYVSTKTSPPATAGSAGLGLSIARRNVTAHGGTIEVANAAASGALFRIILPVERRRA